MMDIAGIKLKRSQANKIMKRADADRDGVVTYQGKM